MAMINRIQMCVSMGRPGGGGGGIGAGTLCNIKIFIIVQELFQE